MRTSHVLEISLLPPPYAPTFDIPPPIMNSTADAPSPLTLTTAPLPFQPLHHPTTHLVNVSPPTPPVDTDGGERRL